MAYPALFPPDLGIILQQLAGILPLTALIEFISLPTKLHNFELTGRVPLWNWPITPAGLRMLLRTKDNDDAAVLDRYDHSKILNCMDGKRGNWYPSSTPTTTRLLLFSDIRKRLSLDNDSPNMHLEHIRIHKLEVVVLLPASKHTNEKAGTKSSSWIKSTHHPWRYTLTSLTGWTLWTAAVALSLASNLYLAAAYLLLLPLSGLVVDITHGPGPVPRQLLNDRPSEHKRMIVACNTTNSLDWWQLYGSSTPLNSLLNNPLLRSRKHTTATITRHAAAIILLQVLTVCQWGLAVASCAFQGWDAFIISAWLGLCALSTSHLYPPERGVRDWFTHDCGLEARVIRASFSSRRSMLCAMVYLNPHTQTDLAAKGAKDALKWIDPVLPPGDDRTAWEDMLLKYIRGDCEFLTSVRRYG